MAELLLEVQTGSPDPARYEDGDVVFAANDHVIQRTNAEIICKPRDGNGRKPVDANGFRLDPLGLVAAYLNRCRRFRMERIAPTQVRRVNLVTLAEEILIEGTPLPDGYYINDVQRVIDTHLNHTKNPAHHTGKAVMGTPGAEIWWEKSRQSTPAELDAIWNAIETQTPERRINRRLWPFTPREKRRYLALSVDDFPHAESSVLMEVERRQITFEQTVTAVTDLQNDFRYRVDFSQNPILWRPRVKEGDLMFDSAGLRCRVMEVFNNRLRVRSRQGVPSLGLAQFEGERRPKKRRRRGLWRGLGLNNVDIDDRAVEVDVRDFDSPFLRAAIVDTKPLTSDEDL